MKFERFEDIIVWQRSQEVLVEIYKLTNNINDFAFKDQIRRAALSISNNIAEGFERRSNNEFKMFLFYAKGSAGEVRNMLYVAKNLLFINNELYNNLIQKIQTISKMLSALIKKL